MLYNRPAMAGKPAIVLVRPEFPENIGFVARAMKNTGFQELRIVGGGPPEERAYVTAVHAQDILSSAQIYPDLERAARDLQVVFAASSKRRKNFSFLNFGDALTRMRSYPPGTRVGILFGNERTGLTSEELRRSNFRFDIPQARRQPSYNLASAVLLTLFGLFWDRRSPAPAAIDDQPLNRKDQEECIRRILDRLEAVGFIHQANTRRMTDLIHDLFGRLTMTDRDRRLLLALFSKGLRPGSEQGQTGKAGLS